MELIFKHDYFKMSYILFNISCDKIKHIENVKWLDRKIAT